jgi:hypothetical protein
MLVLSIGAVSAADIDTEIDSNSDISLSSSIDLDDGNDEFDYVSADDIDTNDSDSSQVLGVSEDEDVIGDGQFARVEFRDAVDGVITFNKAEGFEPGSEGDFDEWGFYFNKVYFLIYDENDEVIPLNDWYDYWEGDFDFDFDFDGNPFDKEQGISLDDEGESPDGYHYFILANLFDSTGMSAWDFVEESGTHELIMYNPDRSISQNVTIVLFPPRKLDASVSIDDANITVNMLTDDEQANFTIYLNDVKVVNGTVNESGETTVSFETTYGVHALKIVQDGLYAKGLTFEKTLYVPEGLPGSFIDLNKTIAENDVVDLAYNFTFDPAEYGVFKDGIPITKDLTINGNNYVIDGNNLARIFNIDNNANVVLKDLIITGANHTSLAGENGGAILLKSGTLTIENCTFIDNSVFYEESNYGAQIFGGAIYASDRTTLNITDSLFKHNLNDAGPNEYAAWMGTDSHGGAIACGDNVNLNVLNTAFVDNKANPSNYGGRNGHGGAIYSIGSNSNNNIINCTFINNTASNGVGAIATRKANIMGCIFINNTATNDRPTIYYEGDGKGTISYNVFLDSNTQIRLRNNFKNVVEEYNWWATNEPADRIRLQDTLSTPNKYLMLEAYNEGETVYVGFIRDSTYGDIPNINALPLREITLEGDVNETSPEFIDGIATVKYTSPITSESQIKATVDGYTIEYNISAGTIQGIEVLFIENTTVGTNGTILIYLSGDNGAVDGTLVVYLNNTMFEVPIVKSVATLKAGDKMNGGIYDISYQYLGSPNYAPILSIIKSDSKFKIEKRDVEITYSINPDNGYITYKVSDSEFNPTGSVTCVIDNGYWTRTWSSTSTTTNLDSSLSNGTHNISLTYNGDTKHIVKTLNDSFDVVKYMPPCIITRDGGKFTFNFTTELSYGGRVTVDFVGPNSFTENLYNLQRDGVASVDVTKKLQNGSYNLTVHFTSSKYKYVSADFNYSFDIFKRNIASMTIDPESPTKTVNTVIPVTVTIKVNDGDPIPTGKVSFDQSGSESSGTLNENGTATITWRNYQEKTGVQVKNVTYKGDINYEPFSIEVTFTCTPTALDVNLVQKGRNVTLTFNDKWGNDNNGVVHIYDYDAYLGNVTGDNGFPEFKVDNLDSGVHYFKVIWENNNGINYTSGKSLILDREPGVSQWGSTGNDIKNSGYSNYTRPVDDVYVVWSNNESIDLNKYPNYYRTEYNGQITEIVHGGATTYSPLITSDGLIFLNDGYYVYVYDKEGNVLFTKAPGRRITGIALYNDTLSITPRTDDEVRIYDLFAGKSYHGEFQWVSSSMYYPVVGPDGRVYISGMFNNMANDGKWITVIKYEERSQNYGNTQKFNWNEAYVTSKPISSVVFDDDGNMWVATVDGIRAVNIYTDANVFADASISINARPVISAANIVYYVSTETENSIYALTPEGYLWNTTVTGTVGTTLAVDNENGFVYSVNREGSLYKYDENDGTETFVYDIGAEGVSIIIDGDGNVYVADKAGYVTAVDSEGNLLWTINLGSRIAGGMAMDKNGVIYAYTNNTIFALGYRDPISIEVTVPEGEYNEKDNVTVTATLNETVEGNVTFTVGDLIQSVPVNGNTAVWTTTLPAGNQVITATFEGNNDFATATNTTNISIAKYKAVTIISAPDISVAYKDSSSMLVATIVSEYGKPLVVNMNVNLNGKTSTVKSDSNGQISIPLDTLTPGTYTAEISFKGSKNYAASNTTAQVTVTKAGTVISAQDVSVVYKDSGAELVANITNEHGKPLVVNVNVDLNGKTTTVKSDSDGKISVPVDTLAAGKYTAVISYKGSKNYEASNTTAKVTVTKAATVISASDVSIAYRDPNGELVADIVSEYGKALVVDVTVNLNGKDYTVKTDSEGKMSLAIDTLTPGKYTATISFKGSKNYAASNATAQVIVTKAGTVISAQDVHIDYKESGAELVATIVNEHGKALVVNLNVNLNGKDYTVKTDSEGKMSLAIDTLAAGKYTATISYKGSKNYEASNTTAQVTVNKARTILFAQDVSAAYKDPNGVAVATIVSEYGKALVVDVTVNLNGKDYTVKSDSNGRVIVPVDTLAPGEYTAAISFKGSKNYAASTSSAKVTVTKAGTVISVQDVSVAQGDSNGKLTATVTNEHGKPLVVNVKVNLNGKTSTVKSDSNGQISVPTKDLASCTYTATLSYNGSANYNASTATAQVTVA